MTIECPKCQHENLDDSAFCAKCGTNIDSDIGLTKTIETPTEELKRGSVFAGRYEIIEELGKGGMGKVYRVEDTKVKEEIALKLIKQEIAADKKTIERFRNELKIARKIRHKNVCAMFDLSEEKESHFITMEYVSGGDLKKFIRRVGQLPTGKAISIAKQICNGLEEAHSLGIVHRDLKPNNIMIDDNGNARIMDFGIARTVKEKGITGSGVMIGTPEYMSPEQAEAKDVDHRSDIYSLGVILYEMTTGRLPFEGDTSLAIAMKHKGETPKDPREYNTQISEDLSAVILRCLDKEKGDRYKNAGEVKAELEKIEQGLPTTERVEPKTRPLTSREITVQFKLRKILIPALAVVVAIAAILIFLLKKGPKLESNRVVISAFVNMTKDSKLDPIGRQAADLVAQGIKTIGDFEVPPIAEFDFSQEKNIEQKQYRRMAKKTKAATVIAGEYYQQEGNLNFHTNIYNAFEQKLMPSPEPVIGLMGDLSEALEILRNKLMSFVLRLHNPLMKPWLSVSSYTPQYEALINCIKGSEFFLRGENDEAIEYFDRAIEIDPNYLLPMAFAAVANRNEERYSAAEPYIEKMMQLQGLSQGERSMLDWFDGCQKGDGERAFRAMQQLEPLAPATSFSYQLGLDALRTNRPYLAIEALLRLDPEGVFMRDWIAYWSLLTRAYHMIGDHEQEIKAAIKAEKQYPNSWTPLRLKIKSLAAIGNLNGVNKVIDESDSKILSDYWNPARLMGVAGIEFKAHGYDAEATEMFKQLLSWLTGRSKEISESSRMKNQLGWAYYLNGNLTEAESVFRDLHESDLENLSSLGSLGFVLAWKGDKEEALQLSGQLENWDRPYLFGDDFYWQAVIFAALGEKEKAVSLLRTAVSQGLYFPDLYCNIALETLWDHPAFIELIKPRD